MKIKNLIILIICCSFQLLSAQLDLEHWLPPYYRGEGISMEESYIYLSTDRDIAFPVNIYNNNILVDQLMLSKSQPIEYYIPDDSMIDTGVTSRTMKAVNMGFHITGQYSFFASLRIAGCSPSGGCISDIIASKGKTALGKEFLVVNDKNILYGNSPKSKNYQTSVMATRDNTHIRFSNFDKRLVFADGSTDDIINVTLNKGQSFIFLALKSDNNPSGILDDNDPNPIGASISSDKPIVVNNGNIGSQDIGERGGNANIDQSVPIEKLGKEFFITNGMTTSDKGVMEKILVVAIKDNTKIFVNNEQNPLITLNKGEYYIGPYGNIRFLPTTQPSFKNAESKVITTTAMYIKSSEPVYLYQLVGGFQNLVRGPSFNQTYSTSGMTFSYPIDKDYSSLPQQDHNNTIVIPFIDHIGAKLTESKLTIKTKNSANISVNGSQLTNASEVVGKEDWKFFTLPLIKGNVEITSDQSLLVDAVGGFIYSGFASSYSGFSNDPFVLVNGACIEEGVFLSLSNQEFEGFQWQRNDVDIPGAIQSVFQPTLPGDYRCVLSYAGFKFITKSVTVINCPYNVLEENFGNICSDFSINAKFHIGNHTFSKVEIITQPQYGSSILNGMVITTTAKENYAGPDRLVYKITATDGYYEIVKVNYVVLPRPIADTKDIIDPYKEESPDYFFDLTSAIINLNGEIFKFYLTEDDALNLKNEITNLKEYKAISNEVFVRVTNSNNCYVIKKVLLKLPPIPPNTDSDVLLPNAFSPNGDGYNDIWDFSILDGYTDLKLDVYNREGKSVFSFTSSYTWDGKDFNGNALPSNSYWVVFSWKQDGATINKNQWVLIKNR